MSDTVIENPFRILVTNDYTFVRDIICGVGNYVAALASKFRHIFCFKRQSQDRHRTVEMSGARTIEFKKVAVSAPTQLICYALRYFYEYISPASYWRLTLRLRKTSLRN